MTIDQLMAIIGVKEVEIISLRMQLGAATARIKEIEDGLRKTSDDSGTNVTPIKS